MMSNKGGNMEEVREDIAEACYGWGYDISLHRRQQMADQILSIEVRKGVTIEDLIKKGVK